MFVLEYGRYSERIGDPSIGLEESHSHLIYLMMKPGGFTLISKKWKKTASKKEIRLKQSNHLKRKRKQRKSSAFN